MRLTVFSAGVLAVCVPVLVIQILVEVVTR
jgi:hypothetical protein